jgi:hypothetical protein
MADDVNFTGNGGGSIGGVASDIFPPIHLSYLHASIGSIPIASALSTID